MFLNNGILRKLMKQAYKSGLAVAQTEERVYLAGNSWEMDVRRSFLPKEILAQIIELAGELPEIGERFSATKEGNQMEGGLLRMEVSATEYNRQAYVTGLILLSADGVHQRVLQDRAARKAYLVNDVFIQIADNLNLEESRGEYRVTAPIYCERGILWMNNAARFHAYWRADEAHEQLLESLGELRLWEDIREGAQE